MVGEVLEVENEYDVLLLDSRSRVRESRSV